MPNATTFEKIRSMVRGHLKDADKQMGDAGNPGPTPGECYAAAHSTVTGAYAGRGITVDQWVELGNEIRTHRETSR